MARTFDAATSIVKVSSTVITSFPVTMAAWFNTNQNNLNTQYEICISQNPALTHFFSLEWIGQTGVRGDFTDGISTLLAVSTSAGAANVWQHACAILYPTGTAAAFLNGGNKGTDVSATITQVTDLSEFWMGAFDNGGAGSNFFGGNLADVAIWKIALSDREVALLGSGVVRPPQLHPEALIAYFPLEEGAGTANAISTKFGWVGKPTGTTNATGSYPPKVVRLPTLRPPISISTQQVPFTVPQLFGRGPLATGVSVASWYPALSEPVRTKAALPAPEHHFFSIDYKWLNPTKTLLNYWYQPLSEPRTPPDRRNVLPIPEQQFFSIDYKWITPTTNLTNYWYEPLSEPVRIKLALPAPEQQFFSIDYKWIAPPGDLSKFYWYRPLEEPVRYKIPFLAHWQQAFTTDANAPLFFPTWYEALTEPVRLKPGLPAPEQLAFTIDYKWIAPPGDLHNFYWYRALEEPVRLKPGLPAPEQQFFSIDYKWIAPPGDLSAFYWYRPLEEPVRYRPLPFPTAEQQFFTVDYKWLNPTTDLRDYWYQPLGEPVRYRTFPAPYHQDFIMDAKWTFVTPITDLRNFWFVPLNEPVRLKPGLPTPEQLAFAIDFQWVAPSGDLGKYYWYRPLEDPVRYRTFPAPYHQDFIMDAKWLFTGVIINDLRNFWFVSLNEPVRLKPGLPTPEQLSFATDWKWITPTLDLQNYWYQPLGEPVRFRVFPTTEQQYFTVDYKWTNPITDLRTWPAPPLSEPTRYRPPPFLSPYQQPFTTDTNAPLFFPNWYEPLNEPIRLKPGLPTPEQQYFSIDYKWANPVTDLSLWQAPPLTEPIRLKVGLAAQHQIAFTMDWQWVAPIQVNVSYSLSAIELFDKLAAVYAASDLIIGANVTITEIGNKPTANVAMTEIVKDLL